MGKLGQGKATALANRKRSRHGCGQPSRRTCRRRGEEQMRAAEEKNRVGAVGRGCRE